MVHGNFKIVLDIKSEDHLWPSVVTLYNFVVLHYHNIMVQINKFWTSKSSSQHYCSLVFGGLLNFWKWGQYIPSRHIIQWCCITSTKTSILLLRSMKTDTSHSSLKSRIVLCLFFVMLIRLPLVVMCKQLWTV
jgi:hypothetical protein